MILRRRSVPMWVLGVCCIFRLAVPVSGQVVVERKGNDQPWVYQMTVDPAGEASPALRYRLIKGANERRPGNAASHYYRALSLLQDQVKELHAIYEIVEKLGDENKQLTEFPVERTRNYVSASEAIFRELESAAACETCDWGIDVGRLSTREAIELRLPEIQASRDLARLLVLRARLAIVEHKHDEAFEAIQLGYQLGHDVSKFPTAISSLVGVAILAITTGPLTELISEPNSPNMYWAAASVPKPLIELQAALEYEFNWTLKIPLIREAKEPHTPEEWKRLMAETFQFKQQMEGNSSLRSTDGTDSKTQLDTLGHLMTEYPRAKEELKLFGYSDEQIEAMPVIQAIALHDAHLIPLKRDRLLCWTFLPYSQAVEPFSRIERWSETYSESGNLSDLRESLGLFEALRPAFGQVLQAVARMDRRVVRIRAIEALRMHAAANGRKFPAALSDIKVVPMPSDPITGGPITYRLEGETAVLEFPPPEPQKIGSSGEVIRLTLRKTP